MADIVHIEMNPADFVTIGTIGPKGQRTFYLQAGDGERLVSIVIEKEHALALSETLNGVLDQMNELVSNYDVADISGWDMDLREPIRPLFRAGQVAYSLDADTGKLLLIIKEMNSLDDLSREPSSLSIWCDRDQIRALITQAMETAKAGRANPKQNGRLVYYWT